MSACPAWPQQQSEPSSTLSLAVFETPAALRTQTRLSIEGVVQPSGSYTTRLGEGLFAFPAIAIQVWSS